jgi:uncharacterized protein YwgA
MSALAERLERLELLARVIRAGTDVLPWCGNVALQKLVYLLQSLFRVNLGYAYGLHHLGPYSPQLADDLSIGEAAGRWESWDESFATADGNIATGRRFSVKARSPFPASVVDAAELEWAGVEANVRRACDKVRGFTGRQLELVATLHYLRNVQEVGEEQLADVLMLLKPKFVRNEVEWGITILATLQAD